MVSVPPLICPTCGAPKSYNGINCRRCYVDAHREKRTLIEIIRDPQFITLFMGKIDKESSDRGCWIWTGSIVPTTGYGTIHLGGRSGRGQSTHRLAYLMFVGPIPTGLHVCHHCDVRACVNPAHLFVATHSENLQDCASKGRINTQKLTADEVISIRSLYASGRVTQLELAYRFGVGQSQVHRIVNRQTWRFLE